MAAGDADVLAPGVGIAAGMATLYGLLYAFMTLYTEERDAQLVEATLTWPVWIKAVGIILIVLSVLVGMPVASFMFGWWVSAAVRRQIESSKGSGAGYWIVAAPAYLLVAALVVAFVVAIVVAWAFFIAFAYFVGLLGFIAWTSRD